MEEQSLALETTPEEGLNWEKIKATLNEVIDFSGSKVDDSIVDKFVARIIPQGNNRFAWFINLSAMELQQIDMAVEGRKNQPTVYIKEKKEETSEDGESSIHSNMLLVRDIALLWQGKKSSPVPIPHRRLYHKNRRKPFWTFTISFEEAQAFRRANGGYLRKNQWEDLAVDVYI